MKAEIKEILDYLEGKEEIPLWRERIKKLDAQDAALLQGAIDDIAALISQSDGQAYPGYYDLFLACACHEREEYRAATQHLKRALPKLRGSKNNQAVAHWLLSVNYSSLKEFDKARKELVKAERLSKARINAMQEKVDAKIRDMFNDPIFELVPPRPQRHVAETIAVTSKSTA